MDTLLKTKILNVLRMSDQGKTTNELCSALHSERHTLTKYLESLRAENVIEYKQIGRTKLWSYNKTPLISILNTTNQISDSFKELLNNLDDKIYFVNKDKHILWANNKVKELQGRKCYENFHENTVCQNCPAEKAMISGNKESHIRDFNDHHVLISTVPVKDVNGQTVAFLEIVKDQ